MRITATSLVTLACLTACQGGSGPAVASFSAPAVSASPRPTTMPSASPSGTGAGSGTVTIAIPTAAPILCSPSPIDVRANGYAIVDCSAADYLGSFTYTIADPKVASVEPPIAPSTAFVVSGLAVGSTTLEIAYPPRGAGSFEIDVTP